MEKNDNNARKLLLNVFPFVWRYSLVQILSQLLPKDFMIIDSISASNDKAICAAIIDFYDGGNIKEIGLATGLATDRILCLTADEAVANLAIKDGLHVIKLPCMLGDFAGTLAKICNKN